MDIPINSAVEVKQILLTKSSNAESIGSYKESRLTPVEIHEGLDGGLGESRDGHYLVFVLWSGYVSLKY